jgi:hypothetical protein
VTYFYDDTDLSGAQNFDDVANVGERFQCSAPKNAVRFRWYAAPNVAVGGTPAIRLFDNSGSLLATIPFDGPIVLDSWNTATPAAPIAIPANTLRWMAVNTTRYIAKSFYAGGSVTRGAVTQTTGCFAGGSSTPNPPTSTTSVTFYVDVDLQDAAEDHTSTGTAGATAGATATDTTRRPTSGSATATANATATASTRRTSTGAATANATANATSTTRRTTSGSAIALAGARATTTPRRVSTGTARAIAAGGSFAATSTAGPRLVTRSRPDRIVTSSRAA